MTISLQHTPIRLNDHLCHRSSPADGVRSRLQHREISGHVVVHQGTALVGFLQNGINEIRHTVITFDCIAEIDDKTLANNHGHYSAAFTKKQYARSLPSQRERARKKPTILLIRFSNHSRIANSTSSATKIRQIVSEISHIWKWNFHKYLHFSLFYQRQGYSVDQSTFKIVCAAKEKLPGRSPGAWVAAVGLEPTRFPAAFWVRCVCHSAMPPLMGIIT